MLLKHSVQLTCVQALDVRTIVMVATCDLNMQIHTLLFFLDALTVQSRLVTILHSLFVQVFLSLFLTVCLFQCKNTNSNVKPQSNSLYVHAYLENKAYSDHGMLVFIWTKEQGSFSWSASFSSIHHLLRLSSTDSHKSEQTDVCGHMARLPSDF